MVQHGRGNTAQNFARTVVLALYLAGGVDCLRQQLRGNLIGFVDDMFASVTRIDALLRGTVQDNPPSVQPAGLLPSCSKSIGTGAFVSLLAFFRVSVGT
jgi:hypothetical protein